MAVAALWAKPRTTISALSSNKRAAEGLGAASQGDDAGLVTSRILRPKPDDPARKTNSPNGAYEIFAPDAHSALRAGELVTFLTDPRYGLVGARGKSKGDHQCLFV